MRITSLSVDNWRNFRSLEFPVGDRLIVVGPNAAGKSNFLDIFRFLGDIAGPGGGLAAALESRGGLSKVKSLSARNHAKGVLRIRLRLEDETDHWEYGLAVRGEQRGHHRPMVAEEKVVKNGKILLSRPNTEDESDEELLTQTHLEQISTNKDFRSISTYLTSIRQPAPGSRQGEPYGSGFLRAVNSTPGKTRTAWWNTIRAALQTAVPQFESLELEVDNSGQPHLVAGYRNWRQNPVRQRETDFSDGTLRLIGLLWAVVSSRKKGGLLLLEEPELSLNAAIVRTLPTMLATAQRGNDLQVLMSTHSPDLLDDEGLHPSEVLVLNVGDNGTEARLLSDIESVRPQLMAGLAGSEIVAGLIDPPRLHDLSRVITG